MSSELEPAIQKKVKVDNALESLKTMTTVVADTGDFESMKQYTPEDATTNPSLILQASQKPQYKEIIDKAIDFVIEHYNELTQGESKPTSAKAKSLRSKKKIEEEKKEEQKPEMKKYKEMTEQEQNQFKELACDAIAVAFGVEISKIVPGYISTECDARLSFDKKATLERAKRIIKLYEKHGVDKKRILIKIAATWEGIEAAKTLKKDGIQCNVTLLFSYCQAIACADAGVTLISPFVGRILDWYKAANPKEDYSKEKDPGVESVCAIYKYYKHYKYKTIIMGASFRNTDEILELAGCDRLTISPKLLQDLQNINNEIPQKLKAEDYAEIALPKLNLDEKKFRWMLNEDQMATEKLSDGIRKFAADTLKLEKIIEDIITEKQK
eukprot:TRINITY_DN1825_c0_g1_i1.p1 TRINITY_DN1825_c0_g1~~TRINITY_DN1825_c0_g1_i1.p1  ORF type:complete len:383 (-),score=108.26 TRINITY_DN1825_c0_g1_i1:90-1238(-)